MQYIRTFDKFGNCIKERITIADEYAGYDIYEYDPKGNMAKSISYNVDGQITGYVLYENNSVGNCIKRTYCNAAGQITGYSISEYDSDGNETKQTYYNTAGQIEQELNASYEKDATGNIVKAYIYSNGRLDNLIEYNVNGKHKRETQYLNGNVRFIAEEDENGNVIMTSEYGTYFTYYEYSVTGIKCTWYNGDQLTLYEFFEYDANGRIIKEIVYNIDGSVRLEIVI